MRDATPRTSARERLRSSSCTAVSRASISTALCPFESTRIAVPPLGATQPSVSMSTLPAMAQPFWWSVWLPPSSVRPGALNTARERVLSGS